MSAPREDNSPAKSVSFDELLGLVHSGSPDAARVLTEQFGIELLIVIRRRLSQVVRPLFDSVDFAQMVWADFFHKAIYENNFENPERLLHFLRGMAEKKVLQMQRHHLSTQKADRRRQVSLDTADVNTEDLVDSQPGPQQVAEVNDSLTRWFATLHATERLILRAVHRGYSRAQIAANLGVDERTIRRRLAGIPPPPPEANAHRILAFLADANESAA